MPKIELETNIRASVETVFDYSSPYGLLGHAANMLFVNRHMHKLLALRNELIKSVAESPLSHSYLDGTSVAD